MRLIEGDSLTLEELNKSALAALRLGQPSYSQHTLEDGRQLLVRAWDQWTFDYILDGDRVPEFTVVAAIKETNLAV